MKELFDLGMAWRVGLLTLLAAAVLLQTQLTLFTFARRDEPGLGLLKGNEVLTLLHLLILTALLNGVHYRHFEGPAAVEALTWLRWCSLALIPLQLKLFVRKPSPTPLAAGLFTLALLPCCDGLGLFFPAALAASVLFFTLRSLAGSLATARLLQKSVSRLSIKEGMDELRAGLLFGGSDGRIILANRGMADLARRLTGNRLENAALFWRDLETFQDRPGLSKIALGDKLLFRDGGTSWEFSRETLHAGGDVVQIFAADTTEIDRASRELERINGELSAQKEELLDVMKNLDAIKREKEILRLQSRIHDVMGHRISILHQYLNQENADFSNLDKLIPMLNSLISDLKKNEPILPAQLLKSLQESFAFIGTEVTLSGPLPDDADRASLLIKILREASTNAVRHAGASRVEARIQRQEDQLVMEIQNDGAAPPEGRPFAEGGGVKGMRRRAAEAGGSLEVIPHPRFRVVVRLPLSSAEDRAGRKGADTNSHSTCLI